MKERPILFSGAMVRALLSGHKTQTRRIMKVQPPEGLDVEVGLFHPTVIDRHGNEQPGEEAFGAFSSDGTWGLKCQHGRPGDQLYVRETWSPDFSGHYPYDKYWFAADDDRSREIEVRDGVRGIFSPESGVHVPFRWRPSIHMPRGASRLDLKIVGVRGERLNDCSDADALAEGVDRTNTSIPGYAKERYRQLWEQINGAGSWAANPWVWVVDFRLLTGKDGT